MYTSPSRSVIAEKYPKPPTWSGKSNSTCGDDHEFPSSLEYRPIICWRRLRVLIDNPRMRPSDNVTGFTMFSCVESLSENIATTIGAAARATFGAESAPLHAANGALTVAASIQTDTNRITGNFTCWTFRFHVGWSTTKEE